MTITHKSKIYSLIAEKTEYPPGHPLWIKFHPDALTEVINGLSSEETAEAEKLAEEWSDQGIPKEIQRVYVSFILLKQHICKLTFVVT